MTSYIFFADSVVFPDFIISAGWRPFKPISKSVAVMTISGFLRFDQNIEENRHGPLFLHDALGSVKAFYKFFLGNFKFHFSSPITINIL